MVNLAVMVAGDVGDGKGLNGPCKRSQQLSLSLSLQSRGAWPVSCRTYTALGDVKGYVRSMYSTQW